MHTNNNHCHDNNNYIPLQDSPLQSTGACPALFGKITYTVLQFDFRGNMVDQRAVLPNACNTDVCTAMISPITCEVQVQATNLYGTTNSSFFSIGEFLIELMTVILAHGWNNIDYNVWPHHDLITISPSSCTTSTQSLLCFLSAPSLQQGHGSHPPVVPALHQSVSSEGVFCVSGPWPLHMHQ